MTRIALCSDAPISTSGRGRSKVKTGCRTCKIRKVKCDEDRPACKRCTSSSRQCEGYGVWGGGSSSLPSTTVTQQTPKKTSSKLPVSRAGSSPAPVLGLRKVTAKELECFEWFVGRSVFKLPGLFRPRFWNSTLIQASTREPAVFDAVLALSTLHRSETFIDKGNRPDIGPDQQKFMLLRYGSALQRLQPDQTDKDQATIRVTIIACVVFVYIDFLRGHYTAGLLHLHHGLRLMQQLPSTNTTTRYRIEGDQESSILDWAMEPLLRLYLQANLLGQLPQPIHPAYDGVAYVELPSAFASLFHARCYLDLLLSRILFLLNGPQQHSVAANMTRAAQYFSESQRILYQLKVWFASASATMSRLGKQTSIRDRITFSSQLNFHLMATILTEFLARPSEMAYDEHEAGFLTLLERSIEMYRVAEIPGIRQAILGPHAELGTSEPVVDMGWLPGLYFIAVHCRARRIRHHAMRLIHTNAHKEGMWDSDLIACIVEEVARIEETDYYGRAKLRDDFDLVQLPTVQDLDDSTLPEWCRVRELLIRLPDDPTGLLTLTYKRQMSGNDYPINQKRVYDLVTKRWTNGLL